MLHSISDRSKAISERIKKERIVKVWSFINPLGEEILFGRKRKKESDIIYSLGVHRKGTSSYFTSIMDWA